MSIMKTRPKDRPYEVWSDGSWQWDILKFYHKTHEAAEADKFARVFCLVHGDYTEMGDVYYREIRNQATLVKSDYTE
jgi:hypothetical protein